MQTSRVSILCRLGMLACFPCIARATGATSTSNSDSSESAETDTYFALSLMLIVSITVFMMLFYRVNWPDADIRKYAWDVIGNTILIVSGVLMFEAVNDVFVSLFAEK